MYHQQYIRIQRKKQEHKMNKKKQEKVYWVALAGMIVVLIGSVFVKSNVIQIAGLLVIIGSVYYLWKMNRKVVPPVKK